MSKILLVCLLFLNIANSFSQIVNIPDTNFKAHLVNYTNPVIDTNGDGEIQVSEAEALDDRLSLGSSEISDLTGLEAFINLKELYSIDNFFTEIDLSALVSLEELRLDETELISINLSNATNLTLIELFTYKIEEIDFTSQINLDYLGIIDDFNSPTLTSITLPNTSTVTSIYLVETAISSIDFSSYINLERLRVSNNNLSSIDVSQNNNLEFLSISNQNIANVDISNLLHLEEFYFNRSNVSSINISNNINLKRIELWETNLEAIDVSNNIQLEYLDIHSTEISSIDLSNQPLLEKLYINNTAIDDINLSNNILLESFNGSFTPLPEIDFSQNTNLSFASLQGNQFENLDMSSSNGLEFLETTGSLNLESINIKNISLSDLNLQASNTPNLNFICVDDIPLAIAQNFNIPPFTTFIDDCALATGELNFIEGTVTYDANDNNCSAGAVPLNNYLINANNGTSNFANTTNENGAYSIKVSEGTYTTQVLGLPPYYDTNPTTASSAFVGFNQTDTADFCVQANTTANDLAVSIFPITEARPGFEADYEINYENVGTTTLTGEVTVVFSDVQVDFVSATPAPNNQTSNSLTFNVGSLGPLQQGSIFATFLLEQPPVNQNGQLLPYTVTITPTAGDATPANNQFYFPQIIVNSYDPNDKTCVQGHQVLFEDADNYLHYIVRFQNLGTASAINVRVVDVLDELLDFSTFRVLSASHEMRTTLNDGQIDFIFDDINLPAEINDPEGSNGYITFKIKPVSTIALFDEIKNRADIYFDFNPPVLTNTTSTAFVDVLGIEEVTKTTIVVYPNPATTLVNIQSSSTIETIEIWNTLGQQINTIQISADKKQVDISTLAMGLYFIKVTTPKGAGVFRVVKQ